MNYYAGNSMPNGDFIATYRGQKLVTKHRIILGYMVHIMTHGFHTRTTARALNKSFYDAGLPWHAYLKCSVVHITISGVEHKLDPLGGEQPYKIFIPI